MSKSINKKGHCKVNRVYLQEILFSKTLFTLCLPTLGGSLLGSLRGNFCVFKFKMRVLGNVPSGIITRKAF